MDSKVPSRFHNISLIIFRKIQLKKFNKAHGDKNLFQVTEIEISAPWSCISLRWKEYEVKILYVNTQNNKYMKQRVHKSSYPVPSLAASKFCLFVVFFLVCFERYEIGMWWPSLRIQWSLMFFRVLYMKMCMQLTSRPNWLYQTAWKMFHHLNNQPIFQSTSI